MPAPLSPKLEIQAYSEASPMEMQVRIAYPKVFSGWGVEEGVPRMPEERARPKPAFRRGRALGTDVRRESGFWVMCYGVSKRPPRTQ